MTANWIVERTTNRRFPYRISIEQDGRLLLAVRAQAAWPGPGQQIFCLREPESSADEAFEPVERVPVAHISRVGRKVAIVLDRATRKRCEFLSIVRAYRDPAKGTHEQIFFRTESGIRAHRSRTRLEIRSAGQPLTVAIDSAEKYPWSFPGATVQRRRLPAGDYGLLNGERIVALVERKTFDNLLAELGAIQALHHQLSDLESHAAAAVVVEAEFADFLDTKRLAGRWPVPFVAKALGEVTAMHPKLPIVFAGNRKLANLWTQQFFTACQGRSDAPQRQLVREVAARYDPVPRGDELDRRIAELALGRDDGCEVVELARWLPGVPLSRIRRVLGRLRAEGRVECTGRGPRARWVRVTSAQ